MKLLWRHEMSWIQDGGEEVEEGAVYHVTLKTVQIQQGASKGARWLEVDEDQLPPEHTVSQYETCKVRTIKAGTLEKLVENLLTAFGDSDFTYVSIFLSTYRGFASTKEVLDLLLDRYGNLETSNCEEDGSQNSAETKNVLRHAIASILRAWLDQCSEDFQEPPDYPCLHKLLDYLTRNMPGSDPERRAQHLLEQFQEQEVVNDNGISDMFALEEEMEIGGSEEFSTFPDDLVAEQLTYIDAELFKRVVPHHCLGCIWSRRDKKENKHLASTIRATIAQFNALTKCVVATILNGKEQKTQQRAKIIDKWINIAHECRILKNFSSLRAIVSALKSSSIYRLKKTWASVSKDSMLIFEELSEIFSDQDNYLAIRELLIKEGTAKCANLDSSVKENQKKTQRRLQVQKDMGIMQGTVPYLGTFLTDFVMLDTALPDYVEGGLINFEKRRREFEVIAQIKLLQSSCNSYCMTSDTKFVQWFRSQQHRSEEESYALSCEVEAAQPNTTTTSPKPRKSMVKRLSLLFQGSDLLASSTPTKEQPKSSPNGNCGMDSISMSDDVCFIPAGTPPTEPQNNESMDSVSVSSCESKHSESENVCIMPTDSPDEPHKKESTDSFSVSPCESKHSESEDVCIMPTDTPDEPHKKLSESSSSCSSLHSMDMSSSEVSSFTNPLSSLPALASNPKLHQRSISVTYPTSAVLPPTYNHRNEDTCIIRISVEDNNGNMYKSIMLTNQDKTPAVIQRAMLKHNLESAPVDDYELVQVISKDKELVIPGTANVFYAMNSRVNSDFLLRKVKQKSRTSLTLPRTTKWGCWSNKNNKIAL